MRKSLFRVLTAAASIALSCLSFGAPLPAPGSGQKARGPAVNSFTLAILRRDGVVIPIVSFGVGGWVDHWPKAGHRQDIPISVDDAPKGWWADKRPIAEWTAWPMSGPSRVIQVKNPVNLVVECEPQVGLQTDYRSAMTRERADMQPFPKDGLATAGDVRIEPVALVDAKSPEWAAVSDRVAAQVGAAEPGLLKDAQIKTPFPEALRAQTPFTPEVIFSTPDVKTGGTVIYFEGVKRYARLQSPVGLITYAVGFVRVGPNGPPEVKLSATLSGPQRQGLVYSLVLGSFHMGDRLFWVVQRSAWGYERFDVVEIRDTEILTIFKTSGGVCE